LNILKSAAAQTAIENSSNQNLIQSTNTYSSSSSSNYVDYNNNNRNNENVHNASGSYQQQQQTSPIRASYTAGSPVNTTNNYHSAFGNGSIVSPKDTATKTETASSAVDYDMNQFKNDFSDLVKANMKLIFEQFDKDNDGKISKQELNFVMCNLFPDEVITENDINEMLIAADLDNNGTIEFEGKLLHREVDFLVK
jgi:hypothetical protein